MKRIVIRSLAIALLLAVLVSAVGCDLLPDFEAIMQSNAAKDMSDTVNDAAIYSTRAILKLEVTQQCRTEDSKIHLGAIETSVSIGSAVIFHQSANTYYALTCAHCIEMKEGCINRKVVAFDVYGNEYTAQVRAADNELDLAYIVISAAYEDAELSVISLADTIPEVTDPVISIGNPHGQPHVVTLGIMNGIREIKLVDFPVISHTAIIGSGSSGGALLNSELELIGINFAGIDEQEYSNGYAIPLEKIREFLTQNGLI